MAPERDDTLRFRVSKQFRERLERAAAYSDKTLSAFIREALTHEMEDVAAKVKKEESAYITRKEKRESGHEESKPDDEEDGEERG